MLCFPDSDNHKQLRMLIRELLNSDLEVTEDADEDVEEEFIKLLFPEFKWVESRDWRIKTFYEFRARSADDFLHEATELEWYTLMQLHYHWDTIYEDFKKEVTTSKDKARFTNAFDRITTQMLGR